MRIVMELKVLWPVLCIFAVSSSEVQEAITAVPGQNIALTCRAPNNSIPIIVLEWSRADLESEYVLVYRDEQLDPDYQHPSFKNRVDLQDRQMKDGDVSVILKNVTINDTGTYECRVIQRGTNRRKRSFLDNDPIRTINLRVVAPPPGPGGTTEDGGKEDGGKEDGGKEDGGKGASVGLIVGLLVPVVLLAAVGFLIYRKRKRQSRASSQPPDNKQSSEMSPVYLQVRSDSPDPDSVLSVNSGKEG